MTQISINEPYVIEYRILSFLIILPPNLNWFDQHGYIAFESLCKLHL